MSLKDIAEKANVSVMTVSRVLNCKSHVAEATRRRVLAVSKELGILPKNRGRRSPAYGCGGKAPAHPTVAILIDMAMSGTFLSELIVAIQRALAEQGFHCVVQSFSGEYADFVRAIRGVGPSLAAGCLAVGHFSAKEVHGVLGANPTTVFVDYMPGPDLDVEINVVSYDNVTAVRTAVRQLLASGCKRVACLQGMAFHHFSRAMREGFLAAVQQTEFENGQLLTSDFTSGGGYKAVSKALASGSEMDGLFTTDEMAFGAMRAIKEAGLRIPEDIRIMGCDGIELGRELDPPLSTVVLDRQALGRRAVERFMEIVKASERVCEHILLAPKIEIRGTCVPDAQDAG